MAYLLKITIAWTLFLILYELLYKNNGKFGANRLYLLFSIGAGLLLPFVPLPSNPPAVITRTQNVINVSASQAAPASTTPVLIYSDTPATARVVAQPVNYGFDFWSVILLIYFTGAALLFIRSLAEVFRIIRLVRTKPVQVVLGRKLIATGKDHSPYSFMGYIFVTDTAMYSTQELEYIVHHEAVHSESRHWLDLWLMQVVCIVFWFHPLIWRYRHLLLLQHEYEADQLAASDDPYSYGHFLLQQTMLSGVPSIAHSFHFSPIKNRIAMLTKKENFKAGNWKYTLLIPALLGCTLITARTGSSLEPAGRHELKYKGNLFAYRSSDTMYYDRQEKRPQLVTREYDRPSQVIYKLNCEPVYQNEYLATPATYRDGQMKYFDYLIDGLRDRRKGTNDSTTGISALNIVVDKTGKIVYFQAEYTWSYLLDRQLKLIYPFSRPSTVLNGLIEQLIEDNPNWKPAMVNGKPVNTVINFKGYGC